ncbi:hypothetical protein CUZ56_00204 [Saezia sanguinis]|uniref:Uncharacterized protein n=1 Tax=Saezia sanguinis TaxID=1965230 RepID=A0A433SG46_9BURK|nr:hypothetical protein [Saezia sanguinis]RUS67727.1 hypothetical protein CUZ56_00204 [Saezia sanguinis]
MSLSLSVKLFVPVEIKVSELIQKTEKIFNELLGLTQELELEFLNSDTREKIDKIELEKCAAFFDRKWSHDGCSLYYSWNEYWEELGYGEQYDFALGTMGLDSSMPMTAIEIAMLIAVAKMGGVNRLMDTQSLLGDGDEYGYISVDDILAKKVTGYSDVYTAAQAFYKKLDYRRFRQ